MDIIEFMDSLYEQVLFDHPYHYDGNLMNLFSYDVLPMVVLLLILKDK